MKTSLFASALLATAAVLACSHDEATSPPADAGTVTPDAGTTTPEASTGAGIRASCTGGDEGAPAPKTADEMNAWLQKRSYTCWAHESEVHLSTGPHGGNVLVYLNAALAGSLASKAQQHPAGSVAVKEIFGQTKDTVTGWAVSVKTDARSDNGNGWYWYEVRSTDPAAPVSEGQGALECTNCHSNGKDFLRTPYPLR